MKLLHSTAIALFIVTGTSTTVLAEQMDINPFQAVDVKTAMVSFADLDLASPADAQILLDRIQKTAKKVCQRLNAGTGVQEMKEARLCAAESYQSGIVAINSKKSIDVEAMAARVTPSLDVVAAD